MTRPARSPRLVFALVVASACLAPLEAARTQSWTAAPGELDGGQADGVAVTDAGELFLAPKLNRLGDGPLLAGEASQVWASATGSNGTIYLGTGPAGRVLELDSAGRAQVLFTAPEPLITALAVARDGKLLAAAAPGGVIYRVGRDGASEVWAETGERYVWALAVGADGTVWAATGERGRVMRVRPDGSSEIFFDGDESHIVSLALGPDGDLIAGGAGRGLLYRIDSDGNALVLYDDELTEVAALLIEPGGSTLAALLAAPPPEKRPPELRLRLPGGAQVGAVEESVTLEESSGPTLRGVIEGLPEGRRTSDGRMRGRLIRVDSRGRATELWSSRTEAPFCLAQRRGGAVFGTGEPGRLYRLEPNGSVSRLATLREGQITELLGLGRVVLAATSNPVAAYRVEPSPADGGVFLSPPFDAGAPARWGSIRWNDPGVGGAELYTRTGNSRLPDATWSAWSPAQVIPGGSPVDNPDGRYLQWRVRFHGAQAPDARLSGVSVSYEPYNRAPELRGLRWKPDRTAISGSARLSWSARDPDGDAIQVLLEYRTLGETEWIRDAAERRMGGADDGSGGIAPGVWREDELTWETELVNEGLYEVRVVASDEAANPPRESFTTPARPSLRVTVDRTPPEIEVSHSADGSFEIVLRDRLSALRGLQLVEGETPRHTLRPVDGVSDSTREVFRFDAPGGTGWSVRATDAAGNRADAPL